MTATTILAITGSLRASSINALLVRAAAELTPAGVTVQSYRGLRDLPHYDADLDTATPPDAVADLRARIAGADGLLVATPEYNHAIPGVLKNALDWASTPSRASVLAGKPTAVMGASPSPFGTIRAQMNLRQVLASTGSAVVPKPEVAVFSAHDSFDDQGRLVDEGAAVRLSGLMAALTADIRRSQLQPAGV